MFSSRATSAFGLAIAMACVAIAGCTGGADGSKRQPVFEVKGTVKMNGAPLPGATVAFVPKEKQRVAMGRTNDNGEYTLTTYDPGDGAEKGDYAVTVIRIVGVAKSGEKAESHGPDYEPSGGHGAADAEEETGDGNLVPPNYGDATKTSLSFKVEEKDNVYDIEIK